jgi:hypothetical protein
MRMTVLAAAAMAALWAWPAGAYENPLFVYERQREVLTDVWFLCLDAQAQRIDDDRMAVALVVAEAMRRCEPARVAVENLTREFWGSSIQFDDEQVRAMVDILMAITDAQTTEELGWSVLRARRARLSAAR